jgi:hypothetical protein
MACCGQNRKSHRAIAPSVVVHYDVAATPIFEYLGVTSLTVIGPNTGRTYRFAQPGARVEVDERDQEAVAHIPKLRRVY